MTQWDQLFDGIRPEYHNADQLKEQLSIIYILEQHGHTVWEADGKHITRCPFHEDVSPSFDVFGENLERWGCYPCAEGGDVFDLVKKLYKIDRFIHVKDKAAELLNEQRRSGWKGATTGRRTQYDADAGERLILSSQADQHAAAWVSLYEDLAKTRPGIAALDPEEVRIDFRIGTQDDWAIFPVFDRDMKLVAYKRRKVGSKSLAATGADFTHVLYGEWHDTDRHKPVLLVEGETDTWAAHYALPEMSVMGLPTGAGSHTSQAYRLADRNVILAFDGDRTGRLALRSWYTALQGVAASVRVLVMADDMDLSKVDDIKSLISQVQVVPAQTHHLSFKDEGIYRVPRSEKTDPEVLSNWTITPTRQLVGQDLSAWEVQMHPSGRSTVISTHDLARETSMVDWASRNGGSWFGSKTDVQHLQAWLQSNQPFLASGSTTDVAGLHNQHFILPVGCVGPDHWVYASGKMDVELHRYLSYMKQDGEWDYLKQLRGMRALHDHSVIDPILAWLAIAPLRSLINPFPSLAVLGGSGTGKTTLLETVLRAFTGSEIAVNLASTTRFAINAFVASTNSLPVWFDEYRPGAAADAIKSLDQIIRDSYNGHGSVKGGMGDHWAQVKMLKAEAPMIVSGEDAFTETSHLERIIPVYLPVQGRNPEALAAVQAWGPTCWAWKWMEMLRWGLVNDQLDLKIVPEEHIGLAPRMQWNIGVLRAGWRLLSDFAALNGAADIGEPDFSRIISTMQTEAKGNPILDALRWCVDEPKASDFIARDGDQIHVRVENFVGYVLRNSSMVLPGNSRAVRRYMMEQMGGVESRTRAFGSHQVRTMAVHADYLKDV